MKGFWACLIGTTVFAAATTARSAELVRAELLADVAAVKPGDAFTVGVRLSIAPTWHVYWKNPGDSGSPTVVNWTLPEGYTAGDVQFPVPVKFQEQSLTSYGYSGVVMLTARITAAPNVSPEGKVPIGATVSWLACQKTCIPGKASVGLEIPIAAKTQPANVEVFAKQQLAVPRTAERVEVAGEIRETGQGEFRIVVPWNENPKTVEFFPYASDALTIEHVKVEFADSKSIISIELRTLAGQKIAEKTLGAVVAYRINSGDWRGIEVQIPLTRGSQEAGAVSGSS